RVAVHYSFGVTPLVVSLFFMFVCLFFFFQAEDGIRDWSVTGVQTCALPISARLPCFAVTGEVLAAELAVDFAAFLELDVQALKRSEERRVGKEGRSRGSPYH